MEELNIISDNGCGFIIRSAGLEPTAEEKEGFTNADWVSQQLDQTAKAALDPDYPALAQVLEYRAALRAYRDNNYEGDRPQLEI